jgi:ABC-type nitrate/sulfonate/bicarbonate transport system permease component
MEIPIIADHLLISLVAWIGGITVGGGLGYVTANVLHSLINAKPDVRRNLSLFPWRTLLFTLMLFVWSPFIVVRLGLGNLTGTIMVGLTLSLIAWPMTMRACLNNWFPSSLRVRLMSGIRTLLLLALFAALGVGFYGGGGLGPYLMRQVSVLEYNKLFEGIMFFGGIALTLDLISGVVEYWVTRDTIPSL